MHAHSRPVPERLFAAVVAPVLVMVTACASSSADRGGRAPSAEATVRSSSPPAITVTSTLDGHGLLPHRIHWQAFPSVPSADVTEVDFLVDGKQLWVEHEAPYYFGDDGNFLVTSFLTAGRHKFAVRAIRQGGQAAWDSVTATVAPAPAPPTALGGTWKSWQPAGGGAPGGYASLVINAEGWYFGPYPLSTLGPDNGGNRIDVAYLRPGLLEIRTGMATGEDKNAGAPFDNDLNGWCDNAPGSPARYRWSVTGHQLRFTFAGGDPCPGFTEFLLAVWTRVHA